MNPCLSQGKKREFRFHQLKETYIDEPADITPFVDQLDEALKERVLQLQKGWWDTWLITCFTVIIRSQLHECQFVRFFLSQWHRNTLWGHAGNCGSYFRGELCSGVKNSIWALNTVDDTHIFVLFQEDFDSEQMSTLASCLAELFKSHFRGDVLPEEITEE